MTREETALTDRVPTAQKLAYGLGALTNNLLGGAIGNMAIILNLGLGMNPATIGWIQGSARLIDAFLDPIMGYVSDHTRSRWGRRKPFLVVGAVLSALVFSSMWQIHAGYSQRFYGWFFFIGTNLFYMALTVYATPFIALGYEMTPDYHERTRIQAYSNVIGQIPWLLLSWSYAFMENKRWFNSGVEGARTLAIVIGVTAAVFGILPGLFCEEPFYAVAGTRSKGKALPLWQRIGFRIREFMQGFRVTLGNRRFLQLAAATFLIFNGFNLIAGLGSYVVIFYVFGGDRLAGARYVGLFGTVLSGCTFGAILAVTWLSTRIGKKQTFMVSTAIAILGYTLKFFSYQPGSPHWLFVPAPLLAFGLAGLFTTVPAMIADVCDLDELEGGSRREGMFGAVYWWMVKLGTAAALGLSGHLLNLTGFDQGLGAGQSTSSLFQMRVFEAGLPIAAYVLAIAAMSAYDLDGRKARWIRLELEKRRGKLRA